MTETETMSLRLIDKAVEAAKDLPPDPLLPYLTTIDGVEYYAIPSPKQAAAIRAFMAAFYQGAFDGLIEAAEDARIAAQLRASAAPLPPLSITSIRDGKPE